MVEPDRLGLIGQTVDGRYTIVEQIGEGGMGAVYRAEHQRLGRQVAIKFLHQAFAKDHEALDRFFTEARAAATLGHPNIAESFDVGELADGSPFIVLELLQGRSIHDEVARAGRLSIRRALRIGRQIALGLDAAHQRGIVHRDLKSENVLLVERAEAPDHVKILDFGVARILEKAGSITQPGHLIGTPEVMPPEQILSPSTVDARVDVYAAGVILYQMLSGHRPFESMPLPALLHRILEESPPPLTFLPDDVRAVVEDAMARDRELRIQTATELRDRIDACLATSPTAPLRTALPGELTEPGPADSTAPSLLAAPAPTLVQRHGPGGRYRSLKLRALGAASTFVVAGVVFAIVHPIGRGPGAPSAWVEIALNPVDLPVAPQPAAPEPAAAPAPPIAPAPDPIARPVNEPADPSEIEFEIDPSPPVNAGRHRPPRPHVPPPPPHGAPRGGAPAMASTELAAAAPVPGPGPIDEPPAVPSAATAHPADPTPAAPAPDAHPSAVALPAPAAAEPARPASLPAPAIKNDGIDVAATREAVLGHVAAIEQCYERAKMDDMNLAGAMTVRITIAPDGAVTGAEVARSTIHSAAVERCVTGEIARWRLPRPPGGHTASFLYPFVFE